MTDASPQLPKMPLGVGDIISNSFSILFGNFIKVMLLGFTGAFIGLIVQSAFLGFGVATGIEEPSAIDPTSIFVGIGLSTIISLVVYGLVTALLIQLAYDAKLGRQSSMGSYLKAALPAVLPIAVLSLVVGILGTIGAIALIIGGLWVYAVFYVMAPVAVIERGGFGSMGRSATLTKEYRWPIVGLFIVVVILSIIMQLVGTTILGMLAGLADGVPGFVILGVIYALFTGVVYGFGGIVVALVYARLREIKEGVAVDQIVSVFE